MIFWSLDAIQREDFPFNNISSNITKDEVTSEDQEQLDEYTYNEVEIAKWWRHHSCLF